jgi:hypothetical protein
MLLLIDFQDRREGGRHCHICQGLWQFQDLLAYAHILGYLPTTVSCSTLQTKNEQGFQPFFASQCPCYVRLFHRCLHIFGKYRG